MVSTKERVKARRLASDITLMQLRSILSAARLASRIENATITASRRGVNPIAAFDSAYHMMIEDEAELLGTSTLLAYLLGYVREREAYDLSLAQPSSIHHSAIRFMRQRAGLSASQLADLQAQHNTQALTVLGDAQPGIQRKLAKRMTYITEQGMHARQATASLRKAFEEIGISPRNKYHLEAIYRTQTQMAYNAARWQVQQDPVLQEVIWGYKYVTVGDDRVRDEHADIDGFTAPKGDPAWAEYWPPNGWACRCQILTLTRPRKEFRPKDMPPPDKGFGFNPGMISFPKPTGGAPVPLPIVPGPVLPVPPVAMPPTDVPSLPEVPKAKPAPKPKLKPKPKMKTVIKKPKLQVRPTATTKARVYTDFGKNMKAYEKWYKRHYGSRINWSLRDKHFKAIERYRNSKLYKKINRGLRQDWDFSIDPRAVVRHKVSLKKTIQDLDDIFKIEISRAPADITVHRGVSTRSFLPPRLRKDLKKAKGFVFSDKGFTSSSFNVEEASKFLRFPKSSTLIRIRVPKGTRSLPLDKVYKPGMGGPGDLALTEKELLFPRGTKFRVVDVDETTRGVVLKQTITRITVEVLP